MIGSKVFHFLNTHTADHWVALLNLLRTFIRTPSIRDSRSINKNKSLARVYGGNKLLLPVKFLRALGSEYYRQLSSRAAVHQFTVQVTVLQNTNQKVKNPLKKVNFHKRVMFIDSVIFIYSFIFPSSERSEKRLQY